MHFSFYWVDLVLSSYEILGTFWYLIHMTAGKDSRCWIIFVDFRTLGGLINLVNGLNCLNRSLINLILLHYLIFTSAMTIFIFKDGRCRHISIAVNCLIYFRLTKSTLISFRLIHHSNFTLGTTTVLTTLTTSRYRLFASTLMSNIRKARPFSHMLILDNIIFGVWEQHRRLN